MDDIGYKSLIWGFPFMTLGLISGAIVAEARRISQYFFDAKILISILSWVVYMVLLYTRWSAGWRGRRAAYMATFAFGTAVLAWAANSLSQYTGLLPHEISAHRRKPQQRTAGFA